MSLIHSNANSNKNNDINEGVARYQSIPNALLLDVREAEEYAQGRIPGALNIPLSALNRIDEAVPTLDTPLFVYCLGGVRSKMAANALIKSGYTDVHDIGAITNYQGELER